VKNLTRLCVTRISELNKSNRTSLCFDVSVGTFREEHGQLRNGHVGRKSANIFDEAIVDLVLVLARYTNVLDRWTYGSDFFFGWGLMAILRKNKNKCKQFKSMGGERSYKIETNSKTVQLLWYVSVEQACHTGGLSMQQLYNLACFLYFYLSLSERRQRPNFEY